MAKPLYYRATGNPKNPLLVFVHGWPDDENLWRAQVAAFSGDYYCVAVRLAGFDEKEEEGCGADFAELAARLDATISRVRKKGVALNLVGHDWGAYLAYIYEHRYGGVDRLITLDVGAVIKPASIGHAAFLISYQWYLIGAWGIGKFFPPAGDYLSRAFARLARAPAAESAQSRMNYLYAKFWMRVLQRRPALPATYQPACPLLFLYGADKKFMFHAPDWEKRMNETPGSAAHAISGAGHWLMRDQAELTNRLMAKFLNAGKKKGSAAR